MLSGVHVVRSLLFCIFCVSHVKLVTLTEFTPVLSGVVFFYLQFSLYSNVMLVVVCFSFLFDIVLSVLRFATSDYPFDICNVF